MNNNINPNPADVTTRYTAAHTYAGRHAEDRHTGAHTLTGQHTALHVEARHVASRRIAPLFLAGTLLATLALGCIPAYALTAAGSPTGSVEYTQGQLVDEAGTVLLTNRFPVITLDWDAAASYPKLNESLNYMNDIIWESSAASLLEDWEDNRDLNPATFPMAFRLDREFTVLRADSTCFSGYMTNTHLGYAYPTVSYSAVLIDSNKGGMWIPTDIFRDGVAPETIDAAIEKELLATNPMLTNALYMSTAANPALHDKIMDALRKNEVPFAVSSDAVYALVSEGILGAHLYGSYALRLPFSEYGDLVNPKYLNAAGEDVSAQFRIEDASAPKNVSIERGVGGQAGSSGQAGQTTTSSYDPAAANPAQNVGQTAGNAGPAAADAGTGHSGAQGGSNTGAQGDGNTGAQGSSNTGAQGGGNTGAQGGAEVQQLTASQLKTLSEGFRPFYGFFSCTYADPYDIDWSEVLYNGFNCAVDWQTGYDEFVRVTGMQLDTSVTAIRKSDVEDIVREFTGTEYSQARKPLDNNWVWLPNIQAYAHAHGDTNYREIDFTAGEIRGDTMTLYFENWDGSVYKAVLNRHGDEWYVYSCMPE